MAETGEPYNVARRAVFEEVAAGRAEGSGGPGAPEAMGRPERHEPLQDEPLHNEAWYAKVAAAAGISVGEIKAQEEADRAQEQADQAAQAAERARLLAP